MPSFGEFPPFVDDTYRYFENLLINDINFPYEWPLPPCWTDEAINWEDKEREKQKHPNRWIGVNGGEACGRLVGGNLNAMLGFWGTPYMPAIREGDILLIEDSAKPASIVEKNFHY